MTAPGAKRHRQRPPGPRGWPLFGRLPAFALDLLGLCRQAAALGPVADISVPGRPALFVNDPDLVGEILVAGHRRYGKIPGSPLRFLVGNGLFTNEDPDDHRRQRRLVQPAFHRQRIDAFGTVMTAATVQRAASWTDRQPLDLHRELTELTMAIVARCLFGADITGEAREVSEALARFAGDLPRFGLAVLLGPLFHRGARFVEPRIAAANTVLETFVADLIAARRANPAQAADLLDMLLAARDEAGDGAGMTDRQVRDEILTLFVAGHETTANALTWTFALLAQHPDVQQALEAEVDAVLGGRTATPTTVRDLRYAKAVLAEAMRLYPPVWLLMRRATAADALGGYPVAAGTDVYISPLLLHRHPGYWTAPDTFQPDRFLDDATGGPSPNGHKPHRYRYIPFGAGPRLCIGEPFAWLESLLLLATITQGFRFSLAAPATRLALQPQATLHPQGGLPVLAHRRQTGANAAPVR
jgi:cytochrome P450